MKKGIKVAALILAMAMVLAGCGEKKEESQYKYDFETFDYSTGVDSEGFFEGVKALDYVTLPDIDNIVLTQEEVQAQIDDIMNDPQYMMMKQLSTPDVTVADGDTVNIDYVGSIDGVEFDGGNTQGNGTDVTIGVTNYIDDFLEQLIGHHPGETFNVEVTFPKDYGVDSLNGKDAVFVTTINYVVSYEKYELSDSWVMGCFYETDGFETVEDFLDACAGNAAYEKVANSLEFADKLPEDVEEICLARRIRQIYDTAKQYGVDADTLCAYQFQQYGISTIGQVIAAYNSYKSIDAQEALFYQAICEQKGITVTDADIQGYYAENEFDADTVKEMEAQLTMPFIKANLLQDKAIHYIYDHYTVQ